MLMLLFASGFFVFTFDQEPGEILIQYLKQLESQQTLVVFIITAITIVSTLAGLPVLYLGVAMGFFIPFYPALAITWLINLMAVMTTYWLVQHVFADYFRNKYGKKKIIKKINKRIKTYGMWTVAVTRAIYIIPTNIINLSFPLSKITAKQYFLGTMIGLIPETLINVATGYLLKNQLILLNDEQRDALKFAGPGTGILLIALFLTIFYFRSRKKRKTGLEEIVPPLK